MTYHPEDASDLETEDPLEGDVDPTGGYDDETEYVDVRDLEVNEDEDGYTVDGHGNRLYEDEKPIRPEDFEKPPTNVYLLNLEATVKEHAMAKGLSEAEAAKVDGATFLLKDSEGNPTDTLEVDIDHYEDMYSRAGVQGFRVAPINGEKDAWNRDKKFVDGSFWSCERPETPEDSSFSMTYGGGTPEAIRQYGKDALQAEVLARAELVELKVPKPSSELIPLNPDAERITADNWDQLSGEGFQWYKNVSNVDSDPEHIDTLIEAFGEDNVRAGQGFDTKADQPDAKSEYEGIYFRKPEVAALQAPAEAGVVTPENWEQMKSEGFEHYTDLNFARVDRHKRQPLGSHHQDYTNRHAKYNIGLAQKKFGKENVALGRPFDPEHDKPFDSPHFIGGSRLGVYVRKSEPSSE